MSQRSKAKSKGGKHAAGRRDQVGQSIRGQQSMPGQQSMEREEQLVAAGSGMAGRHNKKSAR
ncbi:hypothetical protein [Nocardia sp. IFM 10818]